MRLGIDMDGVCCDWSKGAKKLLNYRFELGLDENKEPESWSEIMDSITPEQWKWLWTAGVTKYALFYRLEVIDGTNQALSYLSGRHEVFLLTDRPKASRHDTFRWVVEQLPGIDFAGLVFGKEKWRIPCDAYLDDKPENIVEITENSPQSIPVMRTRAHNMGYKLPVGAFRADGWDEFVSIVEANETRRKCG